MNRKHTDQKQDVYIYQIGKVASTSIANSITACGLNGIQTHFLGKKALTSVFQQVLKPQLNDFFYRHKKGQLIESIEYTRKINVKLQNNEEVLLISLARDPNSWYWSTISQQFKGAKGQYQQYCRIIGWQTDSTEESITKFYSDFIDFIRANKIPKLGEKNSGNQLQKVKKDVTAAEKLFIDELLLINRPLVWFDNHIKVFTGIDIFSERPFDEKHVYLHKNFKLLLIKYENLSESIDTIKDFLELDKFVLKQNNISSQKEHDGLVKKMKALFGSDLANILELKQTRYCKYFAY